jgi:hypothetical protein
MTKDDIIKLAREADLQPYYDSQAIAIERFANLVAAAEREACAKVCDELQQQWRPAGECADAIRARGNT